MGTVGELMVKARVTEVCVSGVHLTATGAYMDEGVDFETWQQACEAICSLQKSSLLWLGDVLLAGERAFSDLAVQWSHSYYSLKTLQNAKWVCKSIPSSRRSGSLGYDHYQAIASLGEDMQDRLIAAADENDWTVKQMRTAVAELRGKQPPPPSVRERVLQAAGSVVEAWRANMTQSELDSRLEALADVYSLLEEVADVHG